MTRENLARKFSPAGFDQPEGSRQNYVKPRPELQEAFEEWVQEFGEKCLDDSNERTYRISCEMVKPLGEIPYREANGLFVGFEPKTDGEAEAGLFISACYNQAPEQVIVIDIVASEVGLIGYKLGKDKAIVNNGEVGIRFGCEASGVVVNNGEVDWGIGEQSDGVIIKNSGDPKYEQNKPFELSGLLVGLKDPENVFFNDQIGKLMGRMNVDLYKRLDEHRKYLENVIKNEAGAQELKSYLEDLKQVTARIKDEESAKRFLERYGPNPRERIEKEIVEDILKKWGFWVD